MQYLKAFFSFAKDVKIGADVIVSDGCSIDERSAVANNISIGKDTCISYECSIGYHVYIGPGAEIGKNCRIRAVQIQIGEGCEIGPDSEISANIGNYTWVGKKCSISAPVGERCVICDNVTFTGKEALPNGVVIPPNHTAKVENGKLILSPKEK